MSRFLPTTMYSDTFSMLENFLNEPVSFRYVSSENFPKVNIKEVKVGDKRSAVIEAALAGYDPKDISIYVDGNQLIISHEKSEEKEVSEEEQKEIFYTQEIKKSSFKRKVFLSDKLDLKNPKVEYLHGIVKITFQEDSQKAPLRLSIPS